MNTFEDFLEVDDWSPVSAGPDGDAIFLARPASAPNTMWVRMEYEGLDEQRAWLSSRQLVEFDCDRWQWRTLQFTSYSRNNLEGDERALESRDYWLPAPRGTFAHAYVTYGCALASIEQ